MTQTFHDLGLPEHLVTSLTQAGFDTPTPIQAKAIPHQLEGKDILGIAQTGSGKTAAFGLPILAGIAALKGRPNPMTTRALILAPTRELAVQIDEVLHKLSGGGRLSTVLVLGGVSRHSQIQKIAKGVDVVIATPGRLQDLLDDRKLKLNETRWLVLDEADRMLDMGFIRPVKAIAAAIGSRRQTALFSATMAPEIAELAKGLLNNPVRVEASPPATTVTTIDQRVILAGSKAKRGVLNELLADEALSRVIIFSRTKHGADRVVKNLTIDGHDAAAIHGNKSQNARQAALKGFSSGKVRILVATDIAARGIDVRDISHVINYELPDDAENYVHRIGRTGRNGASGSAITLCDGTERSKLRDVERLIRRTLPVTGDLHLANETGVKAAPRTSGERPAAPRRGQLPGFTDGQRADGQRQRNNDPREATADGQRADGQRPNGQRKHANAGKHFSGAKKAAILQDRAPRNHVGAPKMDHEQKPAASRPPKQRWNKGQKDAGRARRTDDARPRQIA